MPRVRRYRPLPRGKISVRGSDGRRHPRIQYFGPLEFGLDDSPKSIGGNLSNTSAGGCLVETAHPAKPGARVDRLVGAEPQNPG